MKINELEPIYKILDTNDNGYGPWYGTTTDVSEYLEEQKDQISGYNEEDGFIKVSAQGNASSNWIQGMR